ncbi:Uncharacterized conserved protein YecE, DUF72 family [Allopseudospirillum japonicum]|uniref:Uncharacterized conserved protein YecE, DUF72 family n=1 Tax=Allopseudospirillum japonicum TaxID=64971 RepID=A0A1H6UHG2_9GAMM|nr:DUF72 domain-containing protein [Allopseudospirillum japonicum]SEI91778.1 Uncharacterized conserved protein YecE, DUF72 family [Allopseudospirillum japonicum]
MPAPSFYYGCAQWQHPSWCWPNQQLAPLAAYSQYFNAVEGNTSFYAAPSREKCQQWAWQTPPDFRLWLKLPASCTHQAVFPRAESAQVKDFFDAIEVLEQRVRLIFIQVPARLSVDQWPELKKFIASLPAQYLYALEVRHLDFFAKDAHEQAFNAYLIEHNISRVMLDSRALFNTQADVTLTSVEQASLNKARGKKPRVPLHVLATNQYPIIRFIGHHQSALNQVYLNQWLHQCVQWRQQGKEITFFMHTPDNALAPYQLQKFYQALRQQCPELPELTPLPPALADAQKDLFAT